MLQDLLHAESFTTVRVKLGSVRVSGKCQLLEIYIPLPKVVLLILSAPLNDPASYLWKKVMRVLISNSPAGPRQKRLSWHANLKALVDAANGSLVASSNHSNQTHGIQSFRQTPRHTKLGDSLLHHRYLST